MIAEASEPLTDGPAARAEHVGSRMDWLLWQLADSSFPAGGFAHSSGLEAAWQWGEIRHRAQLSAFANAQLVQLRQYALPFVGAAHADPSTLVVLDELFDQHTTNHVSNRASRTQGRAFLASARRIYQLPEVSTPCGHLAPVFGAVCRRLGVEHSQALSLFMFQHLRNLTASAVRLNLIGPLEAATLQHRLTQTAHELLAAGVPDVDQVHQTNPLFDLWQGAQDRLPARLFQS
jgi:urease accessory protein